MAAPRHPTVPPPRAGRPHVIPRASRTVPPPGTLPRGPAGSDWEEQTGRDAAPPANRFSDTSTTETTVPEDSGEILLEPSVSRPGGAPLVTAQGSGNRIAAGTGETDGSIDELTTAEDAEARPLHAVAALPLPPAAGGRPGSAMGSSASDALNAWLVVQSGADRGRRFQVKTGHTTIGRGVDNDIVLTDIAVSRRHLAISHDGAAFVMTDLGSGNGTLVNDQDEDGAYPLSHGDRLEIGNTVLVFECAELVARARGGDVPIRGKQRAVVGHGDDDLSTVAGRKPVRAPGNGVGGGVEAGFGVGRHGQPTRPPTGGPTRPPPGARLDGPAPGFGARPAHGAPAMTPDPGHRMALQSGQRTMQAPGQLPHPSGVRDVMSAQVPALPAHIPTMSAEALGLPIAGARGPTHQAAQPQAVQQASYAPTPYAGGYSPYPPSAPAYPQVAGGYPMHSAASPVPPRFQYPNGVIAPSQAAERRRLLIGILAVAFVAVSAGIVMAVVHGRGDDTAATAAAGATPASQGATQTDGQRNTARAADPAGQPAAAAPTVKSLDQPVTLASLYGDKQVDSTVFGNDEQFLGDRAAPAPGTGTDAATAGAGSPSAEAPRSREKDRGEDRDRESRRVAPAPRPSRRASAERFVADAGDDGDAGDSGAVVKADALYKQKQFDDASEALRRAAESAPKKDAARLRATADAWEKIGDLLAQGQRSFSSEPNRALDAFKRALSLDGEFGDGAHDGFIGARIGQVAPRAAGIHMVHKEFAEAKRAADDAEMYGAGDQVRTVRESLARRADDLYDQANELAGQGKMVEAADLARQILKMVPKSLPVYAKASKLAKR